MVIIGILVTVVAFAIGFIFGSIFILSNEDAYNELVKSYRESTGTKSDNLPITKIKIEYDVGQYFAYNSVGAYIAKADSVEVLIEILSSRYDHIEFLK